MSVYGVAFYRAEKGRWWDKLIAARTGSPYSHCELIIDLAEDIAVCFSASPREGCVRVKEIKIDDGKWDVIWMPGKSRKTITECDVWKELGAKYDWPGVISAGLHPLPGIQLKKWWFCSEVVYKALFELGYLGNAAEYIPPHIVRPDTLYYICYGFCHGYHYLFMKDLNDKAGQIA
jgi:hypothetical protein